MKNTTQRVCYCNWPLAPAAAVLGLLLNVSTGFAAEAEIKAPASESVVIDDGWHQCEDSPVENGGGN